jgi:hypothetical protein
VAAKTFGRGVSDSSTANDIFSKTASKSRTDAATVADIQIRTIGKVAADNARATDLEFFSLTRPINNALAAQDLAAKTFSRGRADAAQATDIRAKLIGKALFDSAVINDVVNGATAGDNQNFQIIKSPSDTARASDIISIFTTFTRAYSDAARATDLPSKSFGKSRADQAVTSDSGFVKSQGYCSIDYFMEDYVGATRTF